MTITLQDPTTNPALTAEVAYTASLIHPERGERFWDLRDDALTPGNFEDPVCGAIFEAVLEARYGGKPVSLAYIAQYLTNHTDGASDVLKVSLAARQWTGVLESMLTLAAADDEAFVALQSDLKEGMQRRQLMRLAERVKEWCGRGLAAHDIAQRLIDAATETVGGSVGATQALTWEQGLALYEQLHKDVREAIGKVPLTFPPEWELRGLHIRAGQMAVLGGPSGGGKSTMALQMVDHAARTGKRVLHISLEDDPETIATRRTARELMVTAQELLRGDRDKRYLQMREIAASWPGEIETYYMPGRTIGEIARVIDKWALSLPEPNFPGDPRGVVVLDYIQKIQRNPNGNQTDASAYEAIVERLKVLSLQHRIFTFIVSQLTTTGGEVRMEGTSQLMKRCQIVLMVERERLSEDSPALVFTPPDYGQPMVVARPGDLSPMLTLRVVKANMGRTGAVRLAFLGPYYLATGLTAWRARQEGRALRPQPIAPWGYEDERRAAARKYAYEAAASELLAQTNGGIDE